MTDEKLAQEWVNDHGLNPLAAFGSGKRCGLQWTPWMGDWFTSWSPRNSNCNAEGPWDHWVDLALTILSDPLTKIVRPDVHDPGLADRIQHFYDEANRDLTAVELRARFETRKAQR